MTRNSSQSMARVLERLELERPLIVTSRELAGILTAEGIATPVAVFAARMREKGWLLPTGQRGVWEFAPAAVAGPYSSMDPLLQARAFSAAHPTIQMALTMQAGAWAHGLADRAPSVIDVAASGHMGNIKVPAGLRMHAFEPSLPTQTQRGMPALAPESIIVHMAARPAGVPSWQSALEWLPDLAYESKPENVLTELSPRPASVRARVGYLLQGMRPDIAREIMASTAPKSKVRFGPREKSLRNDEAWQVSDTILPFDPRKLESVV